MGLFFEEFKIGQVFNTPSRTITEADIVNFAGISGDFNPLHTDEVYAEKTVFKKRIAHGFLCMSVITGLTARTGIFDGTVVGLLEIENWKFFRPIYIGDTIHAKMTIVEKKETSKKDKGIVTRKVDIINQKGEIVQCGLIKVMIKKQEVIL